jgi:hypothetical protein
MSEVALRESKNGTGAGLLEFLDWAASRGELNPATARSTAVSTRKILSIESNPDAVNILTADPEDLFERFQTLHRTGYSPETLTVYRSRFLNAVAMYRAWLDNRPDWKTAGGWGRRSGRSNNKGARDGGTPRRRKAPAKPVVLSTEVRTPVSNELSASETTSVGSPVSQATSMVPYDLPLRPGLRVRLVLPEMLTRPDAERIAAFVHSLAFDQVEDEGSSVN